MNENASDQPLKLIATTAFGLEAVVGREMQHLGYSTTTLQPGRILTEADHHAICRLNVHLRSAERVLVCVGSFPANDFGLLFDGTKALPWEQWIPADGQFPVRGRSVKSQLSSVPACQRMVKKAVADRLLEAHHVDELPETGPEFRIEVALLNDHVTLTIDTTGAGLHKRGYRPISGKAPLRETLAAALVQLSFWKPDRSLVDPFCGTGTIPIEAALIGRNIAPGARRQFAAEQWSCAESPLAAALTPDLWQSTRAAAIAAELPALPERILATDIHEGALHLARKNAAAANVANDIHFQTKPFVELSSKRQFGCLITNPPYGLRMGEDRELRTLYESFPNVLRRLPTWSHFILTAFADFESVVGQRANRRRKLYNGRVECQYYQYHGPRPQRHSTRDRPESVTPTQQVPPPLPAAVNTDIATNSTTPTTTPTTAPAIQTESGDGNGQLPSTASEATTDPPRRTSKVPAFGGLKPEAQRQATEFGNRLRKRARHLRRWAKKGITCFRLYERDIPEVPLVVDRYDQCLHISEFARPHDRTPAEHADWLDLMKRTAAECLDVSVKNIFVKFRDRQRGKSQYEQRGRQSATFTVGETDLQFKVNLSDYLDTGLFLDHRITRGKVRQLAEGRDFLNLFGYTGSFTVYAASGGANQTTTVDLSRTYLQWAEENLRINDLASGSHHFVRSDAMTYLQQLPATTSFDLVVIDPPTFSNSKDLDFDWDVQRDHVAILNQLIPHLRPDGIVFFSTNFRRFRLDADQLSGYRIVEITQQTIPDDFRNRRIHRCWRLQLASSYPEVTGIAAQGG